jgi:polyisoprenoid-binding protein YceI
MWRPGLIAAAAAFAFNGAPAQAQLPPGVFVGGHDYKTTSPGDYPLDPSHTAVIAKVSHIGYGYSVFRFDRVEGMLDWTPGQPARSSVKLSVETASISTPVQGFAAELAGDGFLKSAAYPTATFVSTSVRQTDASHGQVTGEFTLMGRTRPLTFNVELVGAGKGFGGHPRIGLEARAAINPQDYGLPSMLSAPIQLVIDAEFAKAQ